MINRFDYSNKDMKYYEKALVIRDKVLGEEHPDISETYYGMASVYLNLTEYSEALDYYEKALSVRIKNLDRSMFIQKKRYKALKKSKKPFECL